MLYDPKWERPVETKPDPLSLESLIGWLEKQPADGAYEWRDPRHCLVGQFLRAMGMRDDNQIVCMSVRLARFSSGGPFARIAMGEGAAGPYTFGAALDRAREVPRALTKGELSP